MRLSERDLEEYVLDIAGLAERYGIVLEPGGNGETRIELGPAEERFFTMRGSMPNGRHPPPSVVEISERWASEGHEYERTAYRYELIDHERDYRRAFHRHDDRYFERAFGVLVHEHCESPIGRVGCPHFFGPPVRDGFRAVELLMAVWVGEALDCDALPCLEES